MSDHTVLNRNFKHFGFSLGLDYVVLWELLREPPDLGCERA